ncbi:hypothetical protein HY374_01180 [Candidatus Berkelbacteria bacterium]|nr:hypothetical protein [Candidatus Berkelbacteria bacterium]
MIELKLKLLGLNDTEIAVYLAIVKHGRISPAQVGKTTKINRTTVYSTAKQLIAKGLVAEDLGSRPAQLVALTPESLSEVLDTLEQEIKEKRSALPMLTKELEQLAKQAEYSVPKITFVEDNRVESALYKRLPNWMASIVADDPERTWWGFQDPTFVEHYERWLDHQWAKFDPPEFAGVKLLTNDTSSEQKMGAKQIAKRRMAYWEHTEQFTGSTWVCGNYLVMIFTNKRPHYLVEIHDRVMAHNFRELFKGIWQSLEQ